MPVSEDFRMLVVDQLSAVAPVLTRRMFGGLGVYAKGLFFALVDDDVLYFKVDDSTRPEYEAAGSRPFVPFVGAAAMNGYWMVPPDVLEDVEELSVWTRKSLEIAARAAALKPKPGKQASGGRRATPGRSRKKG